MLALDRRTVIRGCGVVAVLALAVPLAAAAQDESPEGWVVRTDRGGHGGGDLVFRDMPPGWHITTGPAGIFYDPGRRASGEFRVEAETFLFDPGQRNEGFGIFIGGSGLETDAQAYTYFLIRRDGSILVKRRDGADTRTLHGWTPHDAVVTWEEREEGGATARNALAIEATPDELVFEVNGTAVHRMPRADQHVDGIVGLRVNHALDIHLTSLDIEAGG